MFRRCRLRRAEDKLIKLQDFEQLREAIPRLGRPRLDPPELQAAAAAAAAAAGGTMTECSGIIPAFTP